MTLYFLSTSSIHPGGKRRGMSKANMVTPLTSSRHPAPHLRWGARQTPDLAQKYQTPCGRLLTLADQSDHLFAFHQTWTVTHQHTLPPLRGRGRGGEWVGCLSGHALSV